MEKDKEAIYTFAQDLEVLITQSIEAQEKKIEKAKERHDFADALKREGKIETLRFMLSRVNIEGLQAYSLFKKDETDSVWRQMIP